MYAPLAIANTIVLRHPGRSAMGICKLVYLVQGWSLALGRPIVGVLPEVWRYGPIHADVYSAFRHFGHVPPTTAATIPEGITTPTVPDFDSVSLSLIDQVVDHHAGMTDLQLSSLAHAPGSPWKLVAEREGFRVKPGTVVDEKLIAKHFSRLLAESRAAEAA